MKRSSWMTRWALVLSLALAALPATQVAVARAETSGEEVERWWGAAGAILCGGEYRLATTMPAIGMNPYLIGAGLGGCLLAILDIATT